MKTVEEVMRKDVETKGANATVSSAVKAMERKKVGSVLVVSDSEVLGIITSTDVLYKVIAKDKDPKKTKLSEIMNTPIHAIGPGNTLKEAADMMTRHRIKKLPVINKGGELIGILAASDILAADPEFLNMLVNLQFPIEKVGAGS